MSIEFEASIAWLDRPTVDGRTFVLPEEPDGRRVVPVTRSPFPLIALSGPSSDVVGEVREVFLDGAVVRAHGDVWMWDASREVRQALEEGRALACGLDMLPVNGFPPRVEPEDAEGRRVRIYDWAIAGLTVYLDDTRPAWEDACLRARTR